MLRVREFAPKEAQEGQERMLLLLATGFVVLNAVSLSLALKGSLSWSHLWAPLVWAVLMMGAHYLLQRFRPARDPLLLPLYALLTGWGLVLIDRLAPNFLARQMVWLILAVGAMVLVATFPRDLRWLRRYRYTWLTLGLLLLVATLIFGVNPSGAGARLWLSVPFLPDIYFQPSELLKLLLVIFLASYFDEQTHIAALRPSGSRRSHLAFLAPLLLMWGFSIVLLIWQRDLGAAALFFITFLSLLFLATGRWQYVLGGVFLLLFAAVIGYFTFSVVELRVDAWWDPWSEATGRAFQIAQSLYAIGAGGVAGQGVGQGSPAFIPVVHSDFAFAAIAEEWGLVGSFSALACFVLLGYRGLRVAALSGRSFGAYLAAGITILICSQAFLIIAGVVKLLPLTGVTLPFVSYGGSSLLMTSVMMGLLLYLSAKRLPLL